MAVVFIVCLVGLGVVLIALRRDEPLRAPAPPAPQADTVPAPVDIVRADFRMSWPGYEPAAVQAHLEAVARAWAGMLAVPGQDRASPRPAPPPLAPLPPPLPLPRSTLEGTDPDAAAEALRTHAALELLRPR
ncbi:MAG: hypothetical protein ACRD0K_07515 [Egibacteraceae bacterium]